MKRAYLLLLTAALLSTACETNKPVVKKYVPVMLGAGISYMPRPTSEDTVKMLNYISGGYVKTSALDNESESSNSAQLAFSRGYRSRNFNFAFGADGFLGSYSNRFFKPGDAEYFKRSNFYGYQLKTSFNVYKKINNLDFRFIGLSLSYSNEFGDFKEFRQRIHHTENFYSIPSPKIVSLGLSSELVIHDNRYVKYGMRLMVDNTLSDVAFRGLDSDQKPGGRAPRSNLSGAFFVQRKKVFLILEGGELSGRASLGYCF